MKRFFGPGGPACTPEEAHDRSGCEREILLNEDGPIGRSRAPKRVIGGSSSSSSDGGRQDVENGAAQPEASESDSKP